MSASMDLEEIDKAMNGPKEMCSHCGASFPDGLHKCPQCGHLIEHPVSASPSLDD